MTSNVILGIDPGLAKIGYGVLVEGKLKTFGVIETSKDLDLAKRIRQINLEFKGLVQEHNPDLVCIEEFFAPHGKNSMGVHTSKVIGAFLDTCAAYGLEYKLYSPNGMKSEIGGKEAVARKRKGETASAKTKRQKQAVMDAVIEFIGHDPGFKISRNHETDAVGHAIMGYLNKEGL